MVGISKLHILIQYFIKGEVGPKSGEEKSNTHIWLVFNFNLKKKNGIKRSNQIFRAKFLSIRTIQDNKL